MGHVKERAIVRVFLATHLRDGACRTLHYSDDIRPGNVLRPDAGILFYGFYM